MVCGKKEKIMIAVASSQSIQETVCIPYATAEEAHVLLRAELERFLVLVKSLGADDWGKPTACTAWTVRDILAHQAGGYASGTSYRELIHQYSRLPKQGQLPEDAVNETQLSDRRGKSPAELIAELQSVGPIAAQKRAYQFRWVKLVTIPHATAGSLSLRHLMWVIHSRDTWMHRLDICRATGRKFEQDAEHDGRIAALVMLDVAKALTKQRAGRAIVFDLTGPAGGCWKIGTGEPVATIRMDVLNFNIYVSGRFTYQQARPLATLTGDIAQAEAAFKGLLILY
jgi:uncharacterized protein (TIGR03083 family)